MNVYSMVENVLCGLKIFYFRTEPFESLNFVLLAILIRFFFYVDLNKLESSLTVMPK